MKIKTVASFIIVLSAGLFFVCHYKQSKYDLSTESKYEKTIQSIADLLSTIHTNYITNPTAEPKVLVPPVDQWGGELLASTKSNSFYIISAGADEMFHSNDDIVGILVLTNSLKININGKYKDTSFNSSIFATDCE
jgi:hypothetical protein